MVVVARDDGFLDGARVVVVVDEDGATVVVVVVVLVLVFAVVLVVVTGRACGAPAHPTSATAASTARR